MKNFRKLMPKGHDPPKRRTKESVPQVQDSPEEVTPYQEQAPPGEEAEEDSSQKEASPEEKTDDLDAQEPDPSKTLPKGKPKKKKSALKALLKLLIKIAVVVLGIWLALTFVFGMFRFEGNNMYPMLKDGDLCITYKLEEYHSSDVVAYRVGDEIRFGRIIARAGDTVDGDATGLLVNGNHPSEEVFYTTQMLDTDLTLPITLSEGELVILNDYREDLRDSRTYGIINEDDLEGKVIFIFRRRGI